MSAKSEKAKSATVHPRVHYEVIARVAVPRCWAGELLDVEEHLSTLASVTAFKPPTDWPDDLVLWWDRLREQVNGKAVTSLAFYLA